MRVLILGFVLVAGPVFADASAGVDVDVSTSATLGLGAGVDHWVDVGMVNSGFLYGVFPAGKDGVQAGFRSGVSVNHNASLLAVPIDGFVRFDAGSAYVDAILGPWYLTRARDFRTHAALGVGAKFDSVSLGIEAGYLNPAPIVGGRFAFAF